MLSKKASILLGRLLEKKMRKQSAYTRKKKLNEEGELSGSNQGGYTSLMATHFLLGAFGHDLQKAVFKKDENGNPLVDGDGNRITEYKSLDKIDEDDEIDTASPIKGISQVKVQNKVRVYYGPDMKTWMAQAENLYSMLLDAEATNKTEKLDAIKELFRAKFTAPKDTESEGWLSPNEYVTPGSTGKALLTPTNEVMTPEARKEFLVGADKLKKVYKQKFGSHGNTNAYYIDEKKFNPEIFTLAPEPELDENGVVKVDPETGREIPKKVWGADGNITTQKVKKIETKKGTTKFQSILALAKKYKQLDLEEVLKEFYRETEGYKNETKAVAPKKSEAEIKSVQKELNEIPASLPQLKKENIEKQLTGELANEFLKQKTDTKVFTFKGKDYKYFQVEALSGLPPAARTDKELCAWADDQVSSIKTQVDEEVNNKIGPAVSEKMKEVNFQNLGKFGLKMSDGKVYINLLSPYAVKTEKVKKKIAYVEEIKNYKEYLEVLKEKEFKSIFAEFKEGYLESLGKKLKKGEEEIGLDTIQRSIEKKTEMYSQRVSNFLAQFNFRFPKEKLRLDIPNFSNFYSEERKETSIPDPDVFAEEVLPNIIWAYIGGKEVSKNEKFCINTEVILKKKIENAIKHFSEVATSIELTHLYPGTQDDSYKAYLKDVLSIVNPSSMKTAAITDSEVQKLEKELVYLFNYVEEQEEKLNIVGRAPVLNKDQANEIKTLQVEIANLTKQISDFKKSGRKAPTNLLSDLAIAQRKQKKIEGNLGLQAQTTQYFITDSIFSPRTKNGTKSTVSPFGEVGFLMSDKLAKAPNFASFVALIKKGVKTAMFNILGTAKYYAYIVHSNKNLIVNQEDKYLKSVLSDSKFELEKKRLVGDNGNAIIKTLDNFTKTEGGVTVYPFTKVPPKVKSQIVDIIANTEPEFVTSISAKIQEVLDNNKIEFKGGAEKVLKKLVTDNYSRTEIDSATVTTYMAISDEMESDDGDVYSLSDRVISSEWRSSLAEDQPEDEVEQRLLERNKKRDYLKVAKKLYEVPVFKDFMDMIDFDTVFTNREVVTDVYTISTSPYGDADKGAFKMVEQATLNTYQLYLNAGYFAENGKMVFDPEEADIDKENLDQLDFEDIVDIADTIKKDDTYLTDKRLTPFGSTIEASIDIIEQNIKGASRYMLGESSKISATLNLKRRAAKENEIIGFIVIYYLIVKGAIDFDIKLNLKTINNALFNLVSNRKRQILDSLKAEDGEKLLIEELKGKYNKDGRKSLIIFLSDTLLKRDVDSDTVSSLSIKVVGDKPFDIYNSFQKVFADHIKSKGGKGSAKLTLTRKHLDLKALEKIGPTNYLELCEKILGEGNTGVIGDSLKVEMAREKAQKEIETEIKKDIQDNFFYLLKGETSLLDKLFENGLFNVTANLPLLTHTIVMKAYCLLLALDFSNGKKDRLTMLFSSGNQWWQIFNFKGLPKPSLYTSMISFYKNHFKILDKMLSEDQKELKKEEELYVHTQRTFGKPVEKLDIFIETDAEADEEKTAKFKNDFEREAYNFAENNLDKLKAILSELKSDDEGESPIVSDNEAKLYFVDQLNKQLAQGDLIPVIDKSRELNALHNIYNWEKEAKSGGEYINPETGDYSARTKQFIEKYRAIKGMTTSEISSRINSNIQSRQEIKNFLSWEDSLLDMDNIIGLKTEETQVRDLFDTLKQDVPMDDNGAILSNEQIHDLIESAQQQISFAYMNQFINSKKIALQGYEQEISSNRIKEIQAMLDSAKSMYKTVSEELFKALNDVENPTMKQILGDFLKSLNPSLPL